MFLEATAVAVAVRTTARISAVLLTANLVAAAIRLSSVTPRDPEDSSRRARTVDTATFAAFLVSHTIHFACVALLALATEGASMQDSGGWIASMAVAALFYAAAGAVFQGKRRPDRRWTTAWQKRREIAVLTVLFLIFLLSFTFVPHPARFLYVALRVGLLVAFVQFLTAAFRSPKFKTSRPAQASV